MTTGRGIRIAAVVAGGVLAAIVAVRLVSPRGPRVTVVRAEFGALKSWVMTNGIVERVIFDVARAHLPTYVAQVLVTEGQLVEPGDLLVTLDVGAQVVAQLGSAEADRAHLTQQRAGTARLIEKPAATREELDQIDLAITRAKATLAILTLKKESLERSAAMDVNAATLAVQQARDRLQFSEALVTSGRVRASVHGTVYALCEFRPGASDRIVKIIEQELEAPPGSEPRVEVLRT